LSSLTLFASMLCAQQCWLLQFCWKQAKQCHSVCCCIFHLVNADNLIINLEIDLNESNEIKL
jgi:hypothetical protein